ncbi:MAG: HypC/HybG/HupF family hydrogenase formation chaperone [Candidatus Nanopelagicales bacterium]
MCVEVPLELVELHPDGTALARTGISSGTNSTVGTPGPRLVEVNLLTLDGPVAPGDWVLAHAGFALHRVSAAAARDALSIRQESS